MTDQATNGSGGGEATSTGRWERRRLGPLGVMRDRVHMGWAKIAFGPMATIGGVIALLYAAGWVTAEASSPDTPPLIVGGVGALFLLLGLAGMIETTAMALWRARLSRRGRDHPDQPWLGDFDWSSDGSRPDRGNSGGRMLFGAIIVTLFAVPFNYVAFGREASDLSEVEGVIGLIARLFNAVGSSVSVVVAIAVNAVVIGYFGYMLYLLLRRMKYGGSRIAFSRFPFFLGRPLEASWRSDRPLGRYDRITFTLRCVEEELERQGPRHAQYVRYQRWADEYVVEGPGEHRGGEPIAVTFLPPADAPPTEIQRDPPRYWEVEIHAETPGVDFRQTYLVPVYREPEAV